jgi:Calx-beta domain-containing protein/VCBS repeat protein
VSDFNGDNKPDLAMVSGEANAKVSVVLGDGLGGFGLPAKFDIGTFPADLTIADFNGDNKKDLAVANPNLAGSLPTVSVLFGNGAGSLGPKTDYFVEQSPNQILFGDFNNDGRLDIITANEGADNFSVLVNTCGAPVGAGTTIQFSSTNYSVAEDGLMAVITVTRNGDTTGDSSVRYSTADGAASSRSDYITSLGTLHFGPGETFKTFNVLIIDDRRASEENESLSLNLSSPIGATLGSPSMAVLSIQDNELTITTVNPIDSVDFFVRQHYFDFLNRVPDASGLAFWSKEITDCELLPEAERAGCREVKRINVSAAFFLSTEFQQTGYLVYLTYKSAFGDTTSPNVSGPVPIIRLNEFLADSQRLGNGVVVGSGNWEQQLENNKVAYMRDFVMDQRFLNTFPQNMSPAEFVDKLNANTGGVLTTLQRDQLVMQLAGAADSTTGRASVLRQVAENELLRQHEFNRAFVLMEYFGYLRRNPDDALDTNYSGWKFWLDKLDHFNGNFVDAEMVKAFLISSEYRNRFNSPDGL